MCQRLLHRLARELIDALFLATLSRPLAGAERTRLVAAVGQGRDVSHAWPTSLALLNSSEFLFNH